MAQAVALLDSYSTLLCDLLLKKHTDMDPFLFNEDQSDCYYEDANLRVFS